MGMGKFPEWSLTAQNIVLIIMTKTKTDILPMMRPQKVPLREMAGQNDLKSKDIESESPISLNVLQQTRNKWSSGYGKIMTYPHGPGFYIYDRAVSTCFQGKSRNEARQIPRLDKQRGRLP